MASFSREAAEQAAEAEAPLLLFEGQRHRGAAELMRAWEIPPEDIHYDHTARPIATGGQADVYRGTWQGVDVALKIARPASDAAWEA